MEDDRANDLGRTIKNRLWILVQIAKNPAKLPAAISAGIRWVRALEYASKYMYRKALQEIRQIEERTPHFFEARILKCCLLANVGDYEKALALSNAVLRDLENSNRYDEATTAYLTAYVARMGNWAYLQIVEAKRTTEFEQPAVNYDQVDLTKVKNRWKSEFPLEGHPDWPTDGNKESHFA